MLRLKISKGHIQLSFSPEVPSIQGKQIHSCSNALEKEMLIEKCQKMISTSLRLPPLTDSLTIIPNMNYLRFSV